jgi:hypothetical protein
MLVGQDYVEPQNGIGAGRRRDNPGCHGEHRGLRQICALCTRLGDSDASGLIERTAARRYGRLTGPSRWCRGVAGGSWGGERRCDVASDCATC